MTSHRFANSSSVRVRAPPRSSSRVRRDLEGELIRALGLTAVERVLDAEGELASFRRFHDQLAQRGRDLHAQLRRFLGPRRTQGAPRSLARRRDHPGPRAAAARSCTGRRARLSDSTAPTQQLRNMHIARRSLGFGRLGARGNKRLGLVVARREAQVDVEVDAALRVSHGVDE
jgi:hypothetical protein